MKKGNNSVRFRARFEVGEIVRIAPKRAIERTLASRQEIDGCALMDEMLRYCGTEMKILKVVHNVFHERRMTMYQTKAPLYILQGALCEGRTPSFQYRCDRTCYILWHEEWLEALK